MRNLIVLLLYNINVVKFWDKVFDFVFVEVYLFYGLIDLFYV